MTTQMPKYSNTQMPEISISKDQTTKLKFQEGHSAVIIPMTKSKDPKNLRPQDPKLTLCLSTQIGCPMNCQFCHSKETKFQKNLTLDELKHQVTSAMQTLRLSDYQTIRKSFSSIVFMGMGEPLLNLENVLKLCEWLNETYKLSYSKICISTSGIIPKMKKVIDYKFPIQLALSLHSTKQEVRDKIMPGLKQFPIKDLLEVCKQYNEKYKQKIMIEYLMIDGLTDTDEDLQNLTDFNFAKYTNFNLIPVNPTPNQTWKPSDIKRMEHFKDKLREAGYKCFIRESMGEDIEAACGMLK